MSRPLDFPTSTTTNIFGAFLNSPSTTKNGAANENKPPKEVPSRLKESTAERTSPAAVPPMNPFALPAQFTPPASSQSKLTSWQFSFNSSPSKGFGHESQTSVPGQKGSDHDAVSKSPQTRDTQATGNSAEAAGGPGTIKEPSAEAVKSSGMPDTNVKVPARIIKIPKGPKPQGLRVSALDNNSQLAHGPPPFLFKATGVKTSTKTPPMSDNSHSVSDEEPPSDYFYSAQFQDKLKTSKTLISNVRDVLGSSSSHLDESSAARHLYRRAKQLSEFEFRVSRTVGFVGDTGAGKTSVLNSLLDLNKLSFDNGTFTCTRVMTEYIYHDREDYEIHVDAFSEEEVQSQVVRWIRAYRLYHLHKQEMDPKDGNYPVEQATEAAHNLRAMFRGHMGAMDFILEEAEHKIVATMMGWWRAIMPVRGLVSDKYVITTLEGLSSTLKSLSCRYPHYTGPAKWLYIKRIRFV